MPALQMLKRNFSWGHERGVDKSFQMLWMENLERFDELAQQGVIGAFDKRTILELSGDVIKEIARKYKNVQKNVGDMMRGSLIETTARRLKNEAENETKRKMVVRMFKTGKLTIEEIAECSGLSVAEVEQLAELQTV